MYYDVVDKDVTSKQFLNGLVASTGLGARADYRQTGGGGMKWLKHNKKSVGFDVLTAVPIRSMVF